LFCKVCNNCVKGSLSCRARRFEYLENSRSPQNNHIIICVKADLVIRSGFFIWRQFVLPILPPIRTPSFVFSFLLPLERHRY
jgi:hypothetical protein